MELEISKDRENLECYWHAVTPAMAPSGHLLVSFLPPCRFTLLNMPTNHPPLTGDFRNVRFSPREDDHLANYIASHETLSTSRYNATLYAVLGPMSVLEAPEEFAWSRHRPSASWMNRYRNQRSKFDAEIKRSKQEKTYNASVSPSASSAVSVAASQPQTPQASATMRLSETPSKQSTIAGFSQPNANDTAPASPMRPLSSLIDMLLTSTSKLVDKPAATVTSAATLHRGQLTLRPDRPKLSIPPVMPASQRRPLPMISSPVRPHMLASEHNSDTRTTQRADEPGPISTPTATPAMPSPASTPAAALAAADAGVDKRLSKLCRKGKSTFRADYARAVYDETHSLERTEVVLSEMAAAAEARGAEVLGVDGWARVVVLEPLTGMKARISPAVTA
ncbi:hypothetical protein B0H13DRAFT_2664199 [Mycena leptocephala]|nr:hypothetical protein B0H13DRAFT_2664199 [Mycena leptocephala]